MNNNCIRNPIPAKTERIEEYIPVENNAAIKLDANESPYKVSDELKSRLKNIIDDNDFNRYPDPFARELISKFAEVYRLDKANVVAGCGSDELINLLCAALIDSGEATVTSSPDFSMYGFYTSINNGVILNADRLSDGNPDPAAIKAAAQDGKVKLVMLSNPCNPTGSVMLRDEIISLVSSLPCMVVIDEAYGEFCRKDFSVIDLASKLPNLIVLKTMSKAFGLAGLRVGFAVAGVNIISAIRKIKSPYNLNSFSQRAARIALDYSDEIFETAKSISVRTEALYRELIALDGDVKFEAVEPSANFVLLKFSNSEIPSRIHERLLAGSVSVRYSGGSSLRITCGTDEENRIFMHKFKNIINDL